MTATENYLLYPMSGGVRELYSNFGRTSQMPQAAALNKFGGECTPSKPPPVNSCLTLGDNRLYSR